MITTEISHHTTLQVKKARQPQISEAARKLRSQMAEEALEDAKRLKDSTHPCTVCNKTSRYVRDGGWLQGSFHIYACEDGHESAWRSNQGRTLKS